MEKFWRLLEQSIEKNLDLRDVNEWVQVDISPKGKVHVTIVSDKKIEKEVVRQIIENKILESREMYRVGFINVYTQNQAQDLAIEKQTKKNNYISWSEGMYAVGNDVEERKDLQVISFYSYKGGVGRTIALIQTAYSLAQAGKRVLMLDLDIEAPSLHNLFADNLEDEYSGVEYGIVDYLYRTVVQKQEDVPIENMICHLERQDVEGDLFLIPALKTMNSDYIYQIGRLQTEQIQERNAFETIIDYVRAEFDIDVVLIDTRAGFNQWGSLSLLSLSNQIIFVAYPNAENIEGLNVALHVLNNIGKKRYAVAMSKIVRTEEGLERARQLFEKINVSQEELIPIFYNEEIAISNQYPITSEATVGAYKGIADYILDNERIELNKEFLRDGVKEQLLKDIFVDDIQRMCIRSVQRFSNVRQRCVLVYDFQEELYGIGTGKEKRYAIIKNDVREIPGYSFYNKELYAFYESTLLDAQMDIVDKGLKIISETIRHSHVREEFSDLSENTTFDELVKILDYKIFVEADNLMLNTTDVESVRVNKEIKIFIDIKEGMLSSSPDIFWDNMRKMVSFFDKEDISFKFLIHRTLWKKYQEHLAIMKGLVTETRIEEQDIKQFLYSNLNRTAINVYDKYLMEKTSTELLTERRLEGIFLGATMDDILSIVLGVRKDIKLYSSSIITYLHDWVNEKLCSYENILDVLKCAARDELKDSDNEYPDRLIGFSKIQEGLKRCKMGR